MRNKDYSVTKARRSDQSNGKSGTFAGGALTVVERITAQAGQLIIFILAARILGPAEFGVFALVSACAILLLRVSEFGWAQYIMSWAGDSTLPRQVLMIAIFSGVIFAALGMLVGIGLPFVGLSVQTSYLVILFSFWVLLATTSSAQKGIMIWQDKLKSSAFAGILGELAALGVGMGALLTGYGVLSLVFGRLAFQSVHLIASFVSTRMTPAFGLKGAQLHEMLVFSGQLFTTRMIINIRTYAATFIIGGFLGPASVGYYRAAERLVGAMAEIIAVPTEVLAWSLFRQTRDGAKGSLQGFQDRANGFFRILLALAVPLFIWLALSGQDLILGLLGPEWLPALPIVAILALSRAVMLPGLATEAILSLAGQIKRLIPFTILFLVLSVGLILIGVQFGLYAVAWSQVVVGVVVLSATIWMQGRYGQINWTIVARGCLRLLIPMAVGTGAMMLMLASPVVIALTPLIRLGLVTLATLVIYGTVLTITEPGLRAALMSMLQRRSLSGGKP